MDIGAIPLSLVVTAPAGMSRCLLPDWLIAAADGRTLELVVSDAVESGGGRPGIVHLACPGDHVFALRRKGIAAARHDWVVVMEDHCRPFRSMPDEMRAAIARGDADLIAGGVENLTSTTAHSWANFLYSAHGVWPHGKSKAKSASIALLAVRKSALTAQELARDCGFELDALPRLSRAGRMRSAPDARVDHVQEAAMHVQCSGQFHNGRCASFYRRVLARSRLRSAATDMLHAARTMLVSPFGVLAAVRGTPQFRLSHAPRIALLSLFAAAGHLRGLWGDVGISPWRVR